MLARAKVRHGLKCWPQFFNQTRNGRKRFELRRDDRPEEFQVGDELLLKEWNPEPTGKIITPLTGVPFQEVKGYTGREVLVRVDYVMPAETVRQLIHPFLEPDEWDTFVIMSISLI